MLRGLEPRWAMGRQRRGRWGREGLRSIERDGYLDMGMQGTTEARRRIPFQRCISSLILALHCSPSAGEHEISTSTRRKLGSL